MLVSITNTNSGVVNLIGTSIVSENSFKNYGSVNVAGNGQVGEAIINGGFKQYSTGKLYFDLDTRSALKNDVLTINGKALLGGTIIPVARALLPGAYSFLSATNLTTTTDLNIASSIPFNWSLANKGSSFSATPVADFRANDLAMSDTGKSIAGYLQRAWSQSDPAHATLFGYLSQVPTTDSYQSAIQTISGQSLNAQPMNLIMSAFSTLGDGMSCPSFLGSGVSADKKGCLWGKATGGVSNQSSSGSDLGYNTSSAGLRFGGQKEIATHWHLGGSFGLGYSGLKATNFSSYAQTGDVNISLKRDLGALSLSGSLGAGYSTFSNRRSPDLPAIGTALNLNNTYSSNTSMSMFGARLRAAYHVDINDNVYLKPYMDIDIIRSRTSGFSESGLGPLGLNVGSVTQTNMMYSPMLEIGSKFELDNKMMLKAYVAVGASFLPNNARTATSSYIGAMDANGSFQVTSTGPSTVGRLNLGVQLYKSDAIEMKAEYGLMIGQAYSAQTLSARFIYRY